MPNHLSILGIVHTAISIFALLAAVIALFRYGKIAPLTTAGRWYIILTILTCLTSLPIMKTGHFTVAHSVAIIILVLIPIGVYAKSLKFLGKGADYVQIIALSTTIFLSCVPAIVETLTRLPISKPIAAGPNDPIIQTGLKMLMGLYAVGLIYQLIKQRSTKKSGQTPNADVKLG
jgi:hypothetical protein